MRGSATTRPSAALQGQSCSSWSHHFYRECRRAARSAAAAATSPPPPPASARPAPTAAAAGTNTGPPTASSPSNAGTAANGHASSSHISGEGPAPPSQRRQQNPQRGGTKTQQQGPGRNTKRPSSSSSSQPSHSPTAAAAPTRSAPSPAPPRPPPGPLAPRPDHSQGGWLLVDSPAALEDMLDHLAAQLRPQQQRNQQQHQQQQRAVGPQGPPDGAGAADPHGVKAATVSSVAPQPPPQPSSGPAPSSCALAVDCEGVELGRPGGKLCLLQLSVRGAGRGGRGLTIWLVDMCALGWRALSYRSPRDGTTSLRGLLEDASVPKYLYDVRSDSEALQQEYGVRMRGVVDLQLADVAVRQAGGEAGQWVEGLVKALFRALGKGAREAGGGSSRSGDEGEGTVGGGAGGGAGSGFSAARLAADLSEATAVARRYHESNNTQVWSSRPLTPELLSYASTDVRYLHALADALLPRLGRDLYDTVLSETRKRIAQRMLPQNRDVRAAAPDMVGAVRRLQQQRRVVEQQQQQQQAQDGGVYTGGGHPGASGVGGVGVLHAADGSSSSSGGGGGSGVLPWLRTEGGRGGGGRGGRERGLGRPGAGSSGGWRDACYSGLMEGLVAALLLHYNRGAGEQEGEREGQGARGVQERVVGGAAERGTAAAEGRAAAAEGRAAIAEGRAAIAAGRAATAEARAAVAAGRAATAEGGGGAATTAAAPGDGPASPDGYSTSSSAAAPTPELLLPAQPAPGPQAGSADTPMQQASDEAAASPPDASSVPSQAAAAPAPAPPAVVWPSPARASPHSPPPTHAFPNAAAAAPATHVPSLLPQRPLRGPSPPPFVLPSVESVQQAGTVLLIQLNQQQPQNHRQHNPRRGDAGSRMRAAGGGAGAGGGAEGGGKAGEGAAASVTKEVRQVEGEGGMWLRSCRARLVQRLGRGGQAGGSVSEQSRREAAALASWLQLEN